jgi:predicted nucleic acid-binding protein
VLSALRGLVRGGKFDSAAAADLVVDLMVLPVDRWPMSPLLPRTWELRENLTPYDAAFPFLRNTWLPQLDADLVYGSGI